ncbi:MFS general substrate transporter [Pyrrhoderma noxium]|uniref:MFS general substrate transporter n=1 Tax=Pyrrhoderma noxium TaxID=2282107 RepID=A0A286UJV2_9AGAM|nr:MFS general substrate transporter [Pyrrhoderma noxium]
MTKTGRRDSQCHERTSLLVDTQSLTRNPLDDEEQILSSASSSSTQTLTSTPVPWRAVSVILILNGIQPLAYELVFPFINQMILEIGVVDDPERVGYYSGVIESLFAVMSFLFVIPCSSISDRYGRKPVVLISIAILGLSTALFGFSRSYWFMIVTRALGGTSAASWSTMKVMLSELTDRSNQGQVFALFGVAYKVGQILGQPIGGLLSHPERAAAGCFTLRETKPRRKITERMNRSYGSCESEDTLAAEDKPSVPWISVFTPHVVSILTSLMTMVFTSETLFALYPLFAFTPVQYGGLGCSEATIGTHMAIRSFISILQMFLFAPMQRKFGTLRVYQMSMLVWPFTIAFFPILNLLKRWEVGSLLFDGVLFVYFVIWGFGNLSWPASSLMINDAAPSPDSLAAMNGISQLAIVLPQAVTPAFVTSTFAWSISTTLLNGNMIYVILFISVCLASIHCLTLKEPTTDWRDDFKNQSDD